MTFATDAPSADSGPGFLAFLAFFVLALALWFLMRNMNARMRRMSYRQQQAGRGRNDPQADGSTPVVAASGDAGSSGRSSDGPDRGPDPTPSDGPSSGGDSDGGSGSSGGGGDGGGGGGGD
ncbi:hypothetical protein [Oryzobacter terrae]|uniref:hypothetical protein n=1 Tax=Oryzobacter terrae TaxID=1620385 RepID=UPI00366B23A7